MTVASAPPTSALEHCREITRRRARNFYYGLRLLPEPKRSVMYAVYAWMRQADDLVDDTEHGPSDRVAQLRAFGAKTDRAMAGDPPDDDPLWAALAFAAARFDLDSAPFHAMLDGQQDDLEERAYETYEQLLEYCHRVASTVGLICIRVWGYHDDRAPELAEAHGVAFQLTNIVRDVAQDLDEGRVYLPSNDFLELGLTPRDLGAWAKPEACRALIMRQIERARACYERSAPLVSMISADSRPTLWAMTSIYRGLLEKAARDPSRLVLGRRLRLSSLQKATIAVRAKWMLNGRGSRAG